MHIMTIANFENEHAGTESGHIKTIQVELNRKSNVNSSANDLAKRRLCTK